MVIRPARRRVGQERRMWEARSTSSVEPEEEVEEEREGSPDFCSSPEVLICKKTLRGEVREGAWAEER
jgi:hypothetical protein